VGLAPLLRSVGFSLSIGTWLRRLSSLTPRMVGRGGARSLDADQVLSVVDQVVRPELFPAGVCSPGLSMPESEGHEFLAVAIADSTGLGPESLAGSPSVGIEARLGAATAPDHPPTSLPSRSLASMSS
jgi:hypothetical protein